MRPARLGGIHRRLGSAAESVEWLRPAVEADRRAGGRLGQDAHRLRLLDRRGLEAVPGRRPPALAPNRKPTTGKGP